jgi:branched-chain amino acid transport system ATP-binding protein
MLTLKNLDVSYGKVRALRRASLHVKAGEIVALIGGNGAGKTTLLSAVSGLIRPDAGEIGFEGADISRAAPDRIVRAGVSHVPERRLVFKPMSVEDNLLLGSYVRHRFGRKTETARDMEAVYAMFPVLRERRGQAAGTLSGGEQQMLAIGRGLMARPRLLLLDEPSLGLAPLVIRQIFDIIKKINAENKTTIFLVEQNANQALKVAHRGYVMENGRITVADSSANLLANEDVKRAYLGH